MDDRIENLEAACRFEINAQTWAPKKLLNYGANVYRTPHKRFVARRDGEHLGVFESQAEALDAVELAKQGKWVRKPAKLGRRPEPKTEPLEDATAKEWRELFEGTD